MDIEKKEKLLERQREHIICKICKVKVTRSGYAQHTKTQKHKNNIKD